MSRGARLALVFVALVVPLAVLGCSDGDDGGEDDSLTREQGIDILLQQGYTQAGAECTIDNAANQDVDVLDVFTRDQVTQRELQVLATVQEFCVEQFGTTGSTLVAPGTSVTGE